MEMDLIFLLKLWTDPQNFPALLHHPHEAAETGFLLFQRGVEFTQGAPSARMAVSCSNVVIYRQDP